jgi:hypothetical protein
VRQALFRLITNQYEYFFVAYAALDAVFAGMPFLSQHFFVIPGAFGSPTME